MTMQLKKTDTTKAEQFFYLCNLMKTGRRCNHIFSVTLGVKIYLIYEKKLLNIYYDQLLLNVSK